MQYENVLKCDRWCSCYTCLPQTTPAALTAAKTAAPGTGMGTPPKDPRLLTIATAQQYPAHTHTCKQNTNTKKQYTNTYKQ